MTTLGYRFGRRAFALVVLALLVPSLGHVSAQTDDVSAVDGNTYTSPTFAYTVSWDDQVWAATDELSENGYDSLSLESAGSTLSVESFSFYQGNPQACLAGERARIATDEGLDDLSPLFDADGVVSEAFGDDWAQAFYGLPVSGGGDELAGVVFLECRTIVPNSVVMIITGFLQPDASGDQEAAVLDVGSIEMSDIGAPRIDIAEFEPGIWLVEDDLDAFWTEVFADLGYAYEVPAYETFTVPMVYDCNGFVVTEYGPFYCAVDRTVFVDVDQLITSVLPFGVVVVDMVLAHEVGHHVQASLGLSGCMELGCGPDTDSRTVELQADCLAGGWMQDAASRGFVDERDLDRLEAAVMAMFGDPPGTSQDDSAAHGTGDERFAMFMTGYEDGIAACGIK